MTLVKATAAVGLPLNAAIGPNSTLAPQRLETCLRLQTRSRGALLVRAR